MAKLVKDESTVLVLNGVPFSLVREEPPEHNHVCYLCDLSDICYKEFHGLTLIDLCRPTRDDGRWFFKEDWFVLNYKILDYTDLGSAVSEDKL